jgi:SAM-dependent methyltransferase
MKYKNCTDYWLNKGNMTFRGEFEEMYRDIDDPWGCKKGASSLNNRLFLELLFGERRFESVLDVGCGLGSFTSSILTRNGGGRITGCDISETAIEKASATYPHIEFVVRNILTDNLDDLGVFDVIVLSEVLWYILDDIEGVFKKAAKSLSESGILGIHQYFPDDQKFGRNMIDGLDGFESFIKNSTDFHISRKVLSYTEDGRVLLAQLERRS